MKKIMLIFAVLFFGFATSKAQDSLTHISPLPQVGTAKPPPPVKNSPEYFALKSRKYKTTGWVLLSVGSVLGVSGWLIHKNQKEYTLDQLGEGTATEAGSIFLMAAGGTMVLVSVPVFISSANYKKKSKSLSVSFSLQTIHEPYQTGISLDHQPAIGLSFHF